ncbi:glycosyltransferase family protein [Desulfobacula phenolica]|uniref:Glycosyl transferases group 1 n=1 Tax=Desulfobacula phenolica TaxID=90732 RepID=A0A1H2DRW9_9BACT|nr:glycosyltransferase [Desulfobacula phenolica]SDT85501.1 Glycosyl transferases group 1 [Desulfobacula phenolica]
MDKNTLDTPKTKNTLIADEKFWSLVSNQEFSDMIDWLSDQGVSEDKMGEILFEFAQQAIQQNSIIRARIILLFLMQALEDPTEMPPIQKLIGDTYFMESNYEQAREYYGKLPLTPGNIKLCFQTFIPRNEIEGLLLLRDKILARTMEEYHGQIHAIIDEIILQFTTKPEIAEANQNLYKQNMDCLKRIYPFSQNDNNHDHFFSCDLSQIPKADILKISDNFYAKHDNIWSKIFSSEYAKNIKPPKIEQLGNDIMIYSGSLESFSVFIDQIKTDNPEFIKKECRVIIDFSLLGQAIKIIDLAPLCDCDFVIRLIDKNYLKPQLTHLLLERKLPFAERIIYLSKDDPDYFSNHVNPIIIECEKKILNRIAKYEQLLPELFPDDYQSKVIKKIKAGQKLNVLLCTSRHTTYLQHSTRDIAAGFQQLGHNTFIQIEDEDSGMGNRIDVTIENLINFKPDIIFAINHFRYSTFPWFPKSIPFVIWIQDLMPHIRYADNPKLITDQDHIFSFSKYTFPDFFNNSAAFKKKTITYLPIPINNKTYRPLNKIEKKYDVIFISHIVANLNENTLFKFRKNNQNYNTGCSRDIQFLTQLAQKIAQMSLRELCHLYFGNEKIYKRIAIDVCRDISINYSDNLLKHFQVVDEKGETDFCRDLRMMIKIKPVKFLINNGIDVKVFGNHWDKLKGFERAAMGPVKNGAPLNKVLNQSKIVLNISPMASWHMRAADAIGSGSFTITFIDKLDDAPITDLLDKKTEMVEFDDEKDLLKKVRYYLKNKTQRNKIAEKAYNKATKKYSNQAHAKKILDTILYSGLT